MATMAPAAGGFTRADLDALPDDNFRHELIDGAFFVTPSPGLSHQDVLLSLAIQLRPVASERGLHVVIAPFDVVLAEHTVVVPDLLVAPRDAFTRRDLPAPPVLAVEVRSPTTARVDRLVKREVYERAGVGSYWLVDPRAPSITVLELVASTYVERGSAARTQTLHVQRPFAVDLTPSRWVSPA